MPKLTRRKAGRNGAGLKPFAKRIPKDLRSLMLGKRYSIPVGWSTVDILITPATQAVRFNLKTSDPREHKLREAESSFYVDQFFESLRDQRPVQLTNRQAAALGGLFYARVSQGPDAFGPNLTVPALRRDPHQAVTTEELSLVTVGERIDPEASDEVGLYEFLVEELRSRLAVADDAYLEATYGKLVDKVAAECGVPYLTRESRKQVLTSFARLHLAAMETNLRMAQEDYSPDLQLLKFPKWERLATVKPSVAVSLMGLVEDWWSEAKASGRSKSTYDHYKNMFSVLTDFLGHDNAGKLTQSDMLRYKDHRLTAISPKIKRPISASSFRSGDLNAFNSVFSWAVENKRLTTNPAEGITVRVPRKVKLRERDFTDAEARAILKASAGWASKKKDQAFFWVPWLCAYSGARVGEILQLRRQDIYAEGKGLVMHITPEAGTVKGKEAREVPIHAHIIELGFEKFLEERQTGPLFLPSDKDTLTAIKTKSGRMRALVRSVVVDPNVAPNHGWRHSFKSRGFEAGIQEKTLDAICGHKPMTEGRKYGSVSLRTKVDAMKLFPRYAVDDR